MEEDVKTLGDFIAIVKRRKWYIIWPAVGVFVLSVIIALTWPPTYRSTSTILIQEQELPREYVTATVTSYAEQRLQAINQRIMSSPRLTEIIDRFDLYADLRKKWAMEEVIDKMRKKDIKFEMINAEVIDRTGRGKTASIAFSIAYEGPKPAVVQQVANVLASLYLEENLRVREQQTEGATKFMDDERKIIEEQLAAIDKQLADFKRRNINTLPELSQYNLQIVDGIERDIEKYNDQLKVLREKESSLQTQIASVAPDIDESHLSALRTRLVDLRGKYKEEHPDVKTTTAEIAKLEKELAAGEKKTDKKPNNPAYVTLAAQLASTRSEIKSVEQQISSSKKKRDDYQRRIATTPLVEESYRTLINERNNLQLKHDDLTKKYMESKVASGLEKSQMGERFMLIDAARLPEKPVAPNSPAIMFIGLVLGMGAGVGSAALKEFSDRSVRTARELTSALALPVLAVIPEIVTGQDTAQDTKRRRRVIIGIVVATLCCIVIFHFFVMDLDVLWARIVRRINMVI